MMLPRVNYEMPEADHAALIEACAPVACMMIGGVAPLSPQENANNAWRSLGQKMGFDHMTVRPISGKGERHFSAVTSENETQRSERLAREASAERTARIAQLQSEIDNRQKQLVAIQGQQMGEE